MADDDYDFFMYDNDDDNDDDDDNHREGDAHQKDSRHNIHNVAFWDEDEDEQVHSRVGVTQLGSNPVVDHSAPSVKQTFAFSTQALQTPVRSENRVLDMVAYANQLALITQLYANQTQGDPVSGLFDELTQSM